MAAVSEREESPVPAYDPMRQFSELAGDVRDPYPMLADLRETTPVLQVSLEQEMMKAGDVNRSFSLNTSIVKAFNAMLTQSVKG